MKISDALRGISLLYVETAPFIYYTERRAGFVDKMRTIFAEVYNERVGVLTCAVTLPEARMKPLKENDSTLVSYYRAMFYHTTGITVTSVSPLVGDLAANLRAHYNLRTPDALHVAAAIDGGCDAFLTNDTGIKRVNEIRVLILDELELDQTD